MIPVITKLYWSFTSSLSGLTTATAATTELVEGITVLIISHWRSCLCWANVSYTHAHTHTHWHTQNTLLIVPYRWISTPSYRNSSIYCSSPCCHSCSSHCGSGCVWLYDLSNKAEEQEASTPVPAQWWCSSGQVTCQRWHFERTDIGVGSKSWLQYVLIVKK